MKKHFMIPMDAEEFQVFLDSSEDTDARAYVVLVTDKSNVSEIQTNIVWSPGLNSHYLYSPATRAGQTVPTRTFRWVGKTQNVSIEIRAWGETKDLQAIQDFRLGMRPRWNRDLVITLQGEK